MCRSSTAGRRPIERSTRLLPQFFEEHAFEYRRVTDGLKLMAWGFFKKLVIADRLAIYVNEVYAAPQEHTGLTLIIATRVLRVPDLLRLLRLLRHRDRRGAGDGLRADAQLPSPLLLEVDPGVLAALAHLAVDVVSRTTLHPAGLATG